MRSYTVGRHGHFAAPPKQLPLRPEAVRLGRRELEEPDAKGGEFIDQHGEVTKVPAEAIQRQFSQVWSFVLTRPHIVSTLLPRDLDVHEVERVGTSTVGMPTALIR